MRAFTIYWSYLSAVAIIKSINRKDTYKINESFVNFVYFDCNTHFYVTVHLRFIFLGLQEAHTLVGEIPEQTFLLSRPTTNMLQKLFSVQVSQSFKTVLK